MSVQEKFDTGYQLVVVKGQDLGCVFPLQYRNIHLGRKSHPDAADVDWIFLMDASVSRHHASLRWDETQQQYILYHHSRTNPTLVNGRVARQVALKLDDTLQLGMLTLKVHRLQPVLEPEPPQQQATPAPHPIQARTQPSQPLNLPALILLGVALWLIPGCDIPASVKIGLGLALYLLCLTSWRYKKARSRRVRRPLV